MSESDDGGPNRYVPVPREYRRRSRQEGDDRIHRKISLFCFDFFLFFFFRVHEPLFDCIERLLVIYR